MLNYANLDDFEFEDLCRDMMSRKLGVELRSFARGRDGGVDLTDDVHRKSIIVQVKHYQKSEIATLMRSLINELDKVKLLSPDRYFICCSRELSCEKVRELYEHFSPYMESDENIVTILEIDKFLKNPANRDILKKHFKLWLDDLELVRDIYGDAIFVNCESLLRQIRRDHKKFVSTTPYRKALKGLQENRVLMLVGNPGVGKSITAKMLVMHYATQGYKVRYTSAMTQISMLKASLNMDPMSKEVILLDDCFGQAYFEMSYVQSGELLDLISYISGRPNKVLILNSRVTIYKEAQERQRGWGESLEYGDYQVLTVDMNEVSLDEKTKIFDNHLIVSGLSETCLERIRQETDYVQIIQHRNYNPRIIEFVCTPSRCRNLLPEQFLEFVWKNLNNPQEMWKDEYIHKLMPVDRMMLQTLYSLTDTVVDIELLRACFERRIAKHQNIDKTIDQFTATVGRLSDGLINVMVEKGKTTVSMINPSVNDFLRNHLAESTVEMEDLVASFCTPRQFLNSTLSRYNMMADDEFILLAKELLETTRMNLLFFQSQFEREAFITRCICMTKSQLPIYTPDVWGYLSHYDMTSREFYSYYLKSDFIMGALLGDLWECYELERYFLEQDDFDSILHYTDLFYLPDVISALNARICEANRPQFNRQVRYSLAYKLSDHCHSVDEWKYGGRVRRMITNPAYRLPDGTVDKKKIEADIWQKLLEYEREWLMGVLQKLPEEFSDFIRRVPNASFSTMGSIESMIDFILASGDVVCSESTM